MREWADSARLGLAATQRTFGDAILSILVEKDRVCLAPRAGEDDRDAYTNPAR